MTVAFQLCRVRLRRLPDLGHPSGRRPHGGGPGQPYRRDRILTASEAANLAGSPLPRGLAPAEFPGRSVIFARVLAKSPTWRRMGEGLR